MLALQNGKYVIVNNNEFNISSPIDLDTYKLEKINNISEKRDIMIENGFVLDGVKYGFNKTDQQNMLETLTLLNTKLLSGATNPTVYYKPYGVGVMKEYTANEFMAVVNAAEKHKTAIWSKFNLLVISIDDAKTVEELDNIVW